jgi:hypothetical protein
MSTHAEKQRKADSAYLATVIRRKGGGLLWSEIPTRLFEAYQFRNPGAPQVRVNAVGPSGQRIESWIPLSVFDEARDQQSALLVPNSPTDAPATSTGEDSGGSGVLSALTSFFEGFSDGARQPAQRGPTTKVPSSPQAPQQAGEGTGVLPVVLFGGAALGLIYYVSQEPTQTVPPPPGPRQNGSQSSEASDGDSAE